MKNRKTSQAASDLTELATLDEATAYCPGPADSAAGNVPEWCELVLSIRRSGMDWPLTFDAPLRRHDGELIIQVLWEALHPRSGGSIPATLMLELDDVVERIQKRVERGRAPRQTDVGEALGLARSIAIMRSPMSYDLDAVRSEVMDRWASKHH